MHNSTKTIKTANAFLVLDALRKNEGMTVDALVRTTRLSRPTVLGILEEQMARHVIAVGGKVASEFGRQPVLYTLDRKTHFAIGIDFEFPPVRLCVADLAGQIRYEKQWVCQPDLPRQAILERIFAEIEAAMAVSHITIENVIGIGVGIPGTVNKHTNTSRTISRIADWDEEPLYDPLSRRFPVPIYLRNDAHLMSRAATARLGLEDKDFLFIAYRTGIGMAICRNGELVDGSFGNTGYLGHTYFVSQINESASAAIGVVWKPRLPSPPSSGATPSKQGKISPLPTSYPSPMPPPCLRRRGAGLAWPLPTP